MKKVGLSLKFYIVSPFFLALAVFVWYSIVFLCTNEILTEDGTAMDETAKAVLAAAMSVIALSWSLSLLTLLRQMLLGYAYYMDGEGIHQTATAVMILAFVFIVPVRVIPYGAIREICEQDGHLTVRIDKSMVEAHPLLLPFVRSEYHFFSGFTKENDGGAKEMLERFCKK